MDYNIRSAAIISMWVQKNAFTMVWEQVLNNIFKSAWRETSFTLDDGAQPLNLGEGSEKRALVANLCFHGSTS